MFGPLALANRILEVKTKPIGHPITERGANADRQPNRKKTDSTRTDQRADTKQKSGPRNSQRYERERLNKRKQERQRNRPSFVRFNKIQDD